MHSLDLDRVLVTPATAPLLLITTAREAHDVAPALAAAVRGDPARVPALLRYVLRHRPNVAARLLMTLFNHFGEVTVPALDALLHAPDYHQAVALYHHVTLALAAPRPEGTPRPSVDVLLDRHFATSAGDQKLGPPTR
jgi:hypothetical protein